MKSNSSQRYRASSSSIKLNIIACARTPSPKHTENPRAWIRNNKRRKEIKILALLAILKNEIGMQEKKKRNKSQEVGKEEVKYDWIEVAEAGYSIGIIFKTLFGRIEKKLTRASSLDANHLLVKKHSERLHNSRLALATQLMMPTGEKDRQYKQMRNQTLKMSKLYSQDRTMSIKSIFHCISSKVYYLLSESTHLQILGQNKISLPHLRMAGEGFRSVVAFFNKHLNSVIIASRFQKPEWEVFEIVANYEKEYRNNVLIHDTDVPSFFYEGFKLSVELSDRFFHYPIYHKSVDGTGFKEFLEITISLRYDLCYLERILGNAKLEMEKGRGSCSGTSTPKQSVKTKTISVFKAKYTFTPNSCENRGTRNLWIADMTEKYRLHFKDQKEKGKGESVDRGESKQGQKENRVRTAQKARLKPKEVKKRVIRRYVCPDESQDI